VATDQACDNSATSRVEVLADVVPRFTEIVPLTKLVCRAAEAALAAEHTTGPDAVTVLLADDRRLREVNRQFNNNDSVTDVLSFNDTEGWLNGAPPAVLNGRQFVAPGEKPRLGEIVISLEQTARQAAERSIPFERELAMLTVHGLLHLLGYDHAEPDEERVMFGKTDAVLVRLFGE
jgi:probable rRNA maturation factor